MDFDDVAERIRGIPFMTPALGRRVYDHIRATRPEHALEIGTAHGVSAAYIAAALDANGFGHLTTVDHQGAMFDPRPGEVLANAELADHVTIVREHSSYNWFLKERIEESSDAAGNCTPRYDFCYLDGSHNWNLDGLAAVLIEKLLRPRGWLLMDDLTWTYEVDNPSLAPTGECPPLARASESERNQPHVLAVFELIVKQHPSFTRFIREDEWYGWAQKDPAAPRRYELATSRPLGALITAQLHRWRRRQTHRG
jgi:predicted O-methyltransferase YrrM